MKSVIIILYCFCCSLNINGVFAQTPYDQINFTEADQHAATVSFEGNILELARALVKPFYEDVYKSRAIFRWITLNIALDYKFINKGEDIVRPECNEEYDCRSKMQQWEENYLFKILKTKKAIPEGYAKLFKKLCDLTYIQSEIIPGYLRTKPYQIGNNIGVNHFWNAIMIDTVWFYVDASKASGYCPENEESGLLEGFVREYQNYYWMVSWNRLSRTHYPQNNKWVERPLFPKEQFFNKPHYFSVEVLDKLWEEHPSTGVLKLRKADTIHFMFEYRKPIDKIQINSNIYRNPSIYTTVKVSKRKSKQVLDEWAVKKQVYIPFTRNGFRYEFNYIVTEQSLYYVEILFDREPALRYRVRMDEIVR